MAPIQHSISRKVFLLYLLLFFFTSIFISGYTAETQSRNNNNHFFSRRLLDLQNEDGQIVTKKKPSTSPSTKNQTKLIKPIPFPTKNQTKVIKLNSTVNESKNKTKLIKPTSDSIKEVKPSIFKTQLIKKFNSTTSKPTNNSTKSNSVLLTKKSSDLVQPSTPNNKTTKPITTKLTQTQSDKHFSEIQSKTQATDKNPKTQKQTKQSLIDQIDEDDLVSEFRDLPTKFQETFLPDIERISKNSKIYLNRANKEITKGFKPIVGNKYAPTIASIVSFAFIVIPLILVSLIFNRIKAYFSLQKLLIFIQIYLSIYFSILCLSSLVTGLEPLKFFYATSQSTYICVQVLQTLGYVLYLLLLLMYLVLVFSTETGLVLKLLGLVQTFVGFAVGLHYYVTVCHKTVLHQPPKTSWKVDAVYATCFLVICLLGRAERTKKAYLEDGGDEGKKS